MPTRRTFDPFRLLLISVAWRLGRQRDAIDYLREGNRVLQEQLGDERRRLAAKANVADLAFAPAMNSVSGRDS